MRLSVPLPKGAPGRAQQQRQAEVDGKQQNRNKQNAPHKNTSVPSGGGFVLTAVVIGVYNYIPISFYLDVL